MQQPAHERFTTRVVVLLLTVTAATGAAGQAVPQKNVNVIGPTPVNWLYTGNPRMQQNEPECTVSVTNPSWVACGFNDYRGVNDTAIGDAFMGIAMSRDRGRSWISGLHPGHLGDVPTLNQKFGADANLESVPYLMFYNFIAGWRDGTDPGGIFVSRWYEHNREVGPPWEYLDTLTIDTGTSGQFLDKPAFDVSMKDPSLGLPPISVNIPAYNDPRNPANSHEAYTLTTPAARLHLGFAVFVGNDNNDGTKIVYMGSNDGGVTWPVRTRLAESNDINQGISIATANFGQEVLAVWRRFSDNNETSAILYAYSNTGGDRWTKARVLTEFCAFDQGTGPARFRTNALPVAVSNGSEFAVYFAARNDATTTCSFEDGTDRMATVAIEDDFDGARDGLVRQRFNYSRIMMTRAAGGNNMTWSTPVAIDPEEYPAGAINGDGSPIPPGSRIRGHQFMPAAEVAEGIETIAWYDSRLDRLNQLATPVTGGFVEDLILHVEPAEPPATGTSATLLPSFVYSLVPPPTNLPPTDDNFPLRRTIDTFAAQHVPGTGIRPYTVDEDYYPVPPGSVGARSSESTRVSRFASRPHPAAPGGRRQVEWNYPNARLFRKGTAPFIGDYNTVAAVQFRQRVDGTWVPNQTPPAPGIDLFSADEPEFHVSWTSNHHVRGRVFYTGCETWDETLQMWVAAPGKVCDSTYTDPKAHPAMMAPLQGEDGSADGPPLVCTIQQAQPLTRNQNIYTAAMRPGVSASVLSAIKPPRGNISTFVLGLLNGSRQDRFVRLELPAGVDVSFGKDPTTPLLAINVSLPRGSGAARTVFDFANIETDPSVDDTIILTVRDVGTSEVLASLPLQRTSILPLENVQTNDGVPLNLLGDGEFYDLILKREMGTVQSLDFENLDFENTAYMLDFENLDFENLDFENTVLFLDFENLDFENVDLDNTNLLDGLYEQLDIDGAEVLDITNLDFENLDFENRNLFYLDFENLDFENLVYEQLDFENLDFENLDFENLDFENLDFENTVYLLDFENLDFENLDFENLDFENDTLYASDLENLDFENLDFENTAPGDPYTEITWTADSGTNTTTGVDMKPIFSPTLVSAIEQSGTTVLLSVREPYMTSTVISNENAAAGLFCTPQVIVRNQLIYANVLRDDQINSLLFDPSPELEDTATFVTQPDATKIITLRFINPPPAFDTVEELSPNVGIALYAQAGGQINCDAELGGSEVFDVCEVDYQEPDITPPVITLLGGATVSTDEDVAFAEPGFEATDDSDGDITSSVVTSGWDRDTTNPGAYTIFYDVADASGNDALTVSRTVTVLDRTPPVITLLGEAAVTIEAGNTFDDPGATANDSFSPAAAYPADVSGTVNTLRTGTYTLSYDALDDAGNAAATVTRSVQVTDTTAPLVVPTTVDVGGTPQTNLTVEAGTAYSEPGATVSDNASDEPVPPALTITVLDPGGASIPAVTTDVVGAYTVQYTATDASGNVGMTARTVTVVDTVDPTIIIGSPPVYTPPEPFVLEPGETTFNVSWPVQGADLEAGLGMTCSIGDPPIATILPATTSYDATAGTLDATFSYDFPIGSTTVTCSVTDQGGNTDTSDPFTVFVEDRPVIDPATIPPQPFFVEANDPTGYVGPTGALWSVRATDGIDPDPIAATCTPVRDLVFGDNTVTCTATDSAGNLSPAVSFTATVVDTTAPVITTTVNDVTVEANAAAGYVFPGVPSTGLWPAVLASDTVDGSVEALCTPGAESDFALNGGQLSTTHTVTCIARDSRGNPQGNPGDPGFPATAWTSFTVTVRDTTPPVIDPSLLPTFPAALEANGPGGLTPGAPLWTDPVPGAAIDIVDGSLDATCAPGPDSIFPLGATDVSCSATDSRGRKATVERAFTITVGDTTPPDVTLAAGTPNPVEATSAAGASVAFSASAVDIVSGALTPVCKADGVPVTSPRTFPLGETVLTCTATDGQGVQGSATVKIIVEDNTAPTVTATPLTVVTTGTSADVTEAELVANITATDAVDAEPAISCDLPTNPTTFALGEHAIVCTATDDDGNTGSATLTLRVQFAWDFTLVIPKGNVTAGSVLPIDFYYEEPGTETRVDSSALRVAARWRGPFDNRNCTGSTSGDGDGSAAIDAGSSDFRYSAAQRQWQFSWQTPGLPGSYLLTVVPPGDAMSTACVTFK